MSPADPASPAGSVPEPAPAAPAGSVPEPERPPWALTTAVRLGVVGGVLIVLGLALGNDGLALAGTAAGTLSLISVLIWRSQLIQAWRRAKAAGVTGAAGAGGAGAPPPVPPGNPARP